MCLFYVFSTVTNTKVILSLWTIQKNWKWDGFGSRLNWFLILSLITLILLNIFDCPINI